MRFCLEIGRQEKHLVEFSFNQLLGQLVISVNHREIKRGTRVFNEPVREVHTFQIGENEQLLVRIEKERKLLFGERFRVYLNNRLYQYYEGI